MATPRKRNVKKEVVPKKKCLGKCQKEKAHTSFYKTKSPMFPDGMLNICNVCIKENVDVEDMEQVISFLRQIDKPFIQKYWDGAVNSGKHPLGEYIRKVNSLSQVKEKDFDDTLEQGDFGTARDVRGATFPDTIISEEGKTITYSESLVGTWGVGYKKHEYLQLEAFYQDMMLTHEVNTANHKLMLKQLAKLQLKMDNLLNADNYSDYKTIAKAYDDLLKQSGFSPKDRKNGAEATGLSSFSQVWAEIEREGFIEPDMIDYPEDDIDHMLLYFIQFSQRLVGKSVSTKPPENWKEEVINNDINDFIDEEGYEVDGE